MELEQVITKRHSVRKYQDKDVPDELINKIIELAGRAPSAGNLKSYKIFLTRQKIIDKIDAPMYLIICADPDKSGSRYGDRGKNLYSIQDATILASYIQLLLVDNGLDSVWIGAFNEDKIRKKRGIDSQFKPVVVIAFGYAYDSS